MRATERKKNSYCKTTAHDSVLPPVFGVIAESSNGCPPIRTMHRNEIKSSDHFGASDRSRDISDRIAHDSTRTLSSSVIKYTYYYLLRTERSECRLQNEMKEKQSHYPPYFSSSIDCMRIRQKY